MNVVTVGAVAVALVLAGCSSSATSSSGEDAAAAWPSTVSLPEADALAWYARDPGTGSGEVHGVAFRDNSVANEVLNAAYDDGWELFTAGEGGIAEGIYEGPAMRDWALCRDGDLLHVYWLPQESTFADGTPITVPSTQVYVTNDFGGCA
ncbi:hypothetical protein [Demequina sp. NBRC 110056]|uniref:hypothetical protein n=1 Tax=Demequina sp. NBRC 110056 TaxID=1570345 RepID=UPI00117E250E|nr:hypothetical protein [Demequina sp. NBRC 110056]